MEKLVGSYGGCYLKIAPSVPYFKWINMFDFVTAVIRGYGIHFRSVVNFQCSFQNFL